MAGRVTFEMLGFSDCETALAQLPHTTARASARRVLKKAGEPIAEAMAGGAPERSGGLAGSYGVGTRLTPRQRGLHRKQDPVEVFVGTADPAGVQVEFGNDHQSAQPHARPAWEAEKMRALDVIKAELWADIEKTVARARRAGKI